MLDFTLRSILWLEGANSAPNSMGFLWGPAMSHPLPNSLVISLRPIGAKRQPHFDHVDQTQETIHLLLLRYVWPKIPQSPFSPAGTCLLLQFAFPRGGF